MSVSPFWGGSILNFFQYPHSSKSCQGQWATWTMTRDQTMKIFSLTSDTSSFTISCQALWELITYKMPTQSSETSISSTLEERSELPGAAESTTGKIPKHVMIPWSDNSTEGQSSTSGSASKSAPIRNCDNCSKPESGPEKPLKPCSKCQSAHYCSRECQKADFKKHKKVCAEKAQIYAMGADLKMSAPRAPKKEGHRGGLQKWQFDTWV